MISNQFKSAEDDAEDTQFHRDQAKENAEEKVLGDSNYIQLAINSEYGETNRIASYIAALMICQDKYVLQHVESLRAIFSEMLTRPIEALTIELLESDND